MEELQKLFKRIIDEDAIIKIIFSSKRKKSMPYSKVCVRPVVSEQQKVYQSEFFYEKKALHYNIPRNEFISFCLKMIWENFKQVNIFTQTSEIQILASKPERPRITEKPAALEAPALTHNRQKNYIIPDGQPCDFLIKLGVMTPNGQVVKKHYDKFRQINRYLEIVSDVYPFILQQREPAKEMCRVPEPLRIIDFGCGKAYLTFALYYFFRFVKQTPAEITGLDLKEDVINFCSKTAKELQYDGLKFEKGDIADYDGNHADMVVTLHACDTATDYALINAVSWGSSVILSVPCCQHELFSQIKNELHQPMLKHGILKDRLTEYLTDGLRALKLESKGYDVSLIEFTSLEHTARNIMIKAVRRPRYSHVKAQNAKAQYEALKKFYNVNPTIDKL